jgi:maleylpyruvate isomerase
MAPSLAESRAWMSEGTELFARAMGGLSDEAVQGATALPGWTGAHLLAHVAANAEALRNLVRWASTGEETPMYSSPEQRNADIEAGATRPVPELREWIATSAQELDRDLRALTDAQWQHEVRTAQGRLVPATEIPWMRSREVMIHAVDLGGPVAYADLPLEFLVAVIGDAVAKRSASAEGPAVVLSPTDVDQEWRIEGRPDAGRPVSVRGPLAELAAYATGRAASHLTADGDAVPELPRWL